MREDVVPIAQLTLARAHPLQLDLLAFRFWIQRQPPRRGFRAVGPQGVIASYLFEKQKERWDVELSLAAPVEFPDVVQSLPAWATALHKALASLGYCGPQLVLAQQVAELLRTRILGTLSEEEDA
jgi:hypothetical protein